MRHLRHFSQGLISFVALACLANSALAQETRSKLIAEQVAEKAERLEPPPPNKLESAFLFAEKRLAPGVAGTGWYPTLGAFELGAGPGLGIGHRDRLPWMRTRTDVMGALSVRGYERFQGYATVPGIAGRPIDIRAGLLYRDRPQERFFGLGSTSALEDRSTFGLRDVDYTVALIGRPQRHLSVGVEGGYLDAALEPGSDSHFQTLQQRFSDRDAPGLGLAPDFLHSTVFVELNTFDHPEGPRSGGRYRVSLGRFLDVGTEGFNFNRIEAETVHLFPFFNQRRVIAVRGLVLITDPDTGNEVPFYLMPTLGGADDLRGFELTRFRDRNAMLMGLEYRWEIFAALDMALFMDAGKVTREIGDLDFGDLEFDRGVGFRFNTREKMIVRFDIGHGREGMQYHFRIQKAW